MLPRRDTRNYAFVVTPEGERVFGGSAASRFARRIRDMQRAVHLIRLDLKQQVFGLSFGHLWLLLEPALQSAAYYFLLTVIFGMKGADSTFAFFLVAIVFWRSHAMLTTSAPTFLTSKGHQYIDQGFGLEIAFLEFAVQEAVLFFLRFVVLLGFLIVAGYSPHISWLAGLFIGACMFCFTLALALCLSMLGALFKDAGKFVGHFVWLWWYLSPGLYSIGRVPAWAEPLFFLNPFSYIIPAAHSALLSYSFTMQHLASNALIAAVSLMLMVLAWRGVRRFGYRIAHYV